MILGLGFWVWGRRLLTGPLTVDIGVPPIIQCSAGFSP